MSFYIDKSWTLFLDRDGVINERLLADYVKNIEEFKLLPKVIEAILLANQHFGRVVVVTNQQGIAKKIMSECNLFEIHAYCSELLKKENAIIDAYYFAPNFAGESDDLRKPMPGMAFQAKVDFPEIDFKKSVMIGDSKSDIEFGKNLGMKTVYIETEANGALNNLEQADLSTKSLWEAIVKITKL